MMLTIITGHAVIDWKMTHSMKAAPIDGSVSTVVFMDPSPCASFNITRIQIHAGYSPINKAGHAVES